MNVITPDQNFLLKFQNSIKECWSNPAVEDFNSTARTYGEMAAEIEKNTLAWRAAGINPGDKIAISAKSSAAWAVTYFSIECANNVAVLIFPGFTPKDTTHLVNHSESRLLYIEKAAFDGLNFDDMPELVAVIDIASGEVLASRGDFAKAYSQREELFASAHPSGYTAADVDFAKNSNLDDLCSIMYTSGSTGNPKGVMLDNRAFSSQVRDVPAHVDLRRGENVVSVLPYAHIFGMTVDMITPLCIGMHLVVLGLPPVPAYLKPALRKYRPRIFFSVPLILTKLIEDTLGEFIHSKSGEAKLADYKNNPDFCEALATIFMKATGGNLEAFYTGGAAIPAQFEELFVTKLGLPFVTGYGMSETAPVISIGHVGTYKLKECGEALTETLDIKIDSPDPENIPGEILVKGSNVFKGYYKNPEATAAAFTEDGFFHTGDLATMDKDMSLFIVGRCKSMILTSNGQNIFPEEIEVVLNALPGVAESLIVERDERLTAIIVPNMDRLGDVDAESLKNIMDANLKALNDAIPAYSHVNGYELRFEPFSKTPKGSIRRFMYQ